MAELRRSVCPLDCPDACALLVAIENGRVTRLRGDPEHPVTRGFVCEKVARYADRQHSPERLLYPQRRIGRKGEGRFERISWEAALGEIAERLNAVVARYGSEAVLPYSYAGTMGIVQGASMDRRFFHRLGASRLERTICSAAGSAALSMTLGHRYGLEPEQFRHSRLVLLWGANVLGANVHLWPFLVEAVRRGAKLYTIDPVRNRTGRLSHRHYFIHPGSDAALALGMMHVIVRERLYDADYVERYTEGFQALRQRLEQYPPTRVAKLTGLAESEIVELAREYATRRPAAIRLNYGVQRNERGGLAVRAISLLPALVGAWRDVGGGLLLSTSGAFHLDRAALERPDLEQLSGLGRPARAINMVELGRALTELRNPPVMALFVYNSNPAAVAPNQNLVLEGLRREDLFTVVIEQMPTDTAAYADILLPATTFLEHTDLYISYGHYYLSLARPVLEPPGEAKPNAEVFRLLAARMGFQEPCFRDSDEDLVRTALASGHPFLEGISWDALAERGWMRLRVAPEGQPFQPFAQGGFGTASGRLDFAPETLEYAPPSESRLGDAHLRARYPLELVTPKADSGLNSSFGYRDSVDRETATLAMHEEDAALRGIRDGDRVRVYNARGAVVLTARVGRDVMRGVVAARSVRWLRRAPDGRNVNALTSDRLADLGGGATFYSCLVEVERCSD
ncbi:MAG: molybdopterin-dependent oxidoreductase [Bryobacterales bacterium]|nr:molybdopterin-dependent oxidoreductase [Bryobacteraceae bacterium]MDW8130102.1 molybdopterin-dependent oxidoreductase [Bryobacterales bacterium]